MALNGFKNSMNVSILVITCVTYNINNLDYVHWLHWCISVVSETLDDLRFSLVTMFDVTSHSFLGIVNYKTMTWVDN